MEYSAVDGLIRILSFLNICVHIDIVAVPSRIRSRLINQAEGIGTFCLQTFQLIFNGEQYKTAFHVRKSNARPEITDPLFVHECTCVCMHLLYMHSLSFVMQDDILSPRPDGILAKTLHGMFFSPSST